MMRALVALCVRHSGAVTALTVLALLLGSWGALHSPLDVFPEFVPTQVDVQTEAPGFAPQQVEELVTKPIENAVNGTAGLATLRSESIPGLSVLTITFARNVDVHVARQGIAERLAELGSTLPAGVGTPKLSPLVSSTMDLLKIGLLSNKVDAYTLRDAACRHRPCWTGGRSSAGPWCSRRAGKASASRRRRAGCCRAPPGARRSPAAPRVRPRSSRT